MYNDVETGGRRLSAHDSALGSVLNDDTIEQRLEERARRDSMTVSSIILMSPFLSIRKLVKDMVTMTIDKQDLSRVGVNQ